MALPSHIAKKLRQHMGDEHGGYLVNWLDEMRAEHQQHMAEMRACEERLIKRMDAGFAKVDDRFAKVDQQMAVLRVAIAESKAELLKWSFVFWVGAVGAIAALAGVLK